MDDDYPLDLNVRGKQPPKNPHTVPLPTPPGDPAVKRNKLTLKKGNYDDLACSLYPDKKKKGATGYVAGNQVKDLQQDLIDMSFLKQKEPDGDFGEKTDKALREFQQAALKNERLVKGNTELRTISAISFPGPADGVYDENTGNEIDVWKKNNWVKPLRCYKKKDACNEIRTFQEYLQDIGLYQDKRIDAWFFNHTQSAVEQFQDAAEKGLFWKSDTDHTLVEIEEKLIGYKKSMLDGPTQDMLREVKEKGLKVPIALKGISDSVGVGGKNKPEDVKTVKAKLQELGYPLKDTEEKLTDEDVKAIKFFQAEISDIKAKIDAVLEIWLPDGLISKGGDTDKKLFSEQAPKYLPRKKGNVKKIKKDMQDEKNSASTEDVKNHWKKIEQVWNCVSVYLPDDSYMTSGYRSSDSQRKILQKWFNEKYKDKITGKYGKDEWKKYTDMQGVNDSVADPKMCQMIKGATKQLIAVPGSSAHQKGRAIDIGGSADVDQVKALLWCHIEFYENNIVTKILPERNGCLHFEFKQG